MLNLLLNVSKNKVLRFLVLVFFFFFSFKAVAYAYTLGETYNVKIRGAFTIQNSSTGTIDSRIVPVLTNNINAPYSTFLDERASQPFNSITPVDSKGNRTGEFFLNSIPSGSSKTLNYEYIVKANSIDYQLNPVNVMEDYNYTSDLDVYLQPDFHIESDDPYIINLMNSLRGTLPSIEQNHPYYITKAIYDYVQTHMYFTKDANASNMGALFAAHYNVGNSEDYSDLMVALLRASNIPARTVVGYHLKTTDLTNGEINLLNNSNYKHHHWVEVFLQGYGWVAFDPTISSATLTSYSVVDETGASYLVNGYPLVVQAYSPLLTPTYNYFGKLPDLYVKERYDYLNGNNLANATLLPISFSEEWFAEKVQVNSFNPFINIRINEALAYSPTPVTLTVSGDRQDGTLNETISNQVIKWTSSDNAIATVDNNGIVTFTGTKDGTVTITAEYDGVSSSVSTTVNLIGLTSIHIDQQTLSYNETVTQLTVTGTYSDGSNKPITGSTWSSNNPNVAVIDQYGRVTFTGANGTVTITASYGGYSDTVTVVVNIPSLVSIKINQTLSYSATPVQLTITGTYSDGSTKPIVGATWTTDNSNVATVDNYGLVKFTGKNGLVTITANYQGLNDPVSTTVDILTLQSIKIDQQLAYSGTPVQLTATGTYSDGSIQSLSNVTWNSDNTNVATVDNNGLVTFTGNIGIVSITATYQGLTSTVSTTVGVINLESISIDQPFYYSDTPLQLTVSGLYSDGSSKTLTGATWSSSDTNVATVDSNGLVTFTGLDGDVIIYAKYEGLTASVSTSVNLILLNSISIDQTLAYNDTIVQLTLTAYYSDGSIKPINGASWISNNTDVAVVDNLGRVTFTGNNGSVTITATYHGLTDTISTTVNIIKLESINIDQTLSYSDTPVQLTITGIYTDGSTKPLTAAAWSSDNINVATVNNSGIVTFTGNNGTVSITATYQGFTDYVVTAVGSVTLDAISIDQTLSYSDTPVQLTVSGTYSDGSKQTLTGATWDSDNPSVAVIDNNGLVSFTGSNGTVKITATYQGLVDYVSVTVGSSTLNSISIDQIFSYSATPIQLSATGHFSDGSSRPLTNVAWTSDNTNVATVISNGLVTFTGNNGTVTITAEYQGYTDSVTTNVNLATLDSIKIDQGLNYSESPIQLTVTGYYSDGSTKYITGATWSSNNTNVAIVSNYGRVTFTGNNGSVTITAAYRGLTASITTNVDLVTLDAIKIDQTLVYSNSPVTLSVTGSYSDGSTQAITGIAWSSSNVNIATVDDNGIVTFTGKIGQVSITASYRGLSDTVSANVGSDSLASITIDQSLYYSDTPRTFTVTGTYIDGTSKPLSGVTWTSSDSNIATVNSNGLVTFTGAYGQVTITASFQGLTDTVSTTVGTVMIKSINIDQNLTYSVTPVQLTVTGTYSDNSTKALPDVTWSSNNTNVATVDSNGLVTFTGANGTVSIIASYNGLKDHVIGVVGPISLLSLKIDQNLSYSAVPVQLTVTGQYSDGSTQVIPELTWSSNNTNVAAIDNNGLLTYTSNSGVATITASYNNLTTFKTVTVGTQVLQSISIDQTLSYSQTPIQLSVSGNYSDGSTSAITGAVWTSSNTGVAMVNSSGLVTFTGNNGSVTITASYNGLTSTVTADVNSNSLTSISIDQDLTYSDIPVQLSVTGHYSDGSSTPLHGISWTSSNTTVAIVNSSGLVTFTGTNGTVTIRATYQDLSSARTVTVSNATLNYIRIDQTLQYSTSSVQLTVTGYYSDGTTRPLTDGIAWYSSNSTVATVNSTGLVFFTGKLGTVTIYANYLDKSHSVTTDVDINTLDSISINQNLSYSTTPIQLTLTGHFSDGSTQVLSGATWHSSNPNVATVSSNGLVSFTGNDGTVTITAGYEGLVTSKTAVVDSATTTSLSSITINENLYFSNQAQQLTITGHYSDGSTKVITDAYWYTSNSAIANVNDNGVVTFTGTYGTVTITAYYQGKTDTVTSMVSYQNLDTITIDQSIAYSKYPIQLTITGHYSDGSKRALSSSLAIWSSDNTNVARVSDEGLVTFTGNDGYVVIKANYQGKTAIVTTNVTIKKEPTLSSIHIKEKLSFSNQPVQLHLYGKYSDGTEKLLDKDVKWNTNNPFIASVNGKGIVTFTGVGGSVTIKALYKTYHASVTVEVEELPVESVNIEGNLNYSDQLVPLALTTTYTNGYKRKVVLGGEWISHNPMVATVDRFGFVKFTGKSGLVIIEAKYKDKSAFVYTVVRQNGLKYIKISQDLEYSEEPIQLSVRGFYTNGNITILKNVTWISSNPDIATVDKEGVVQFHNYYGEVVITAKYDGFIDSISTAPTIYENYGYPVVEKIIMKPMNPTPNDIVTFEIKTNVSDENIRHVVWENKQDSYKLGFHKVGVKFMDANGRWSNYKYYIFKVSPENETNFVNIPYSPFKDHIVDNADIESNAIENLQYASSIHAKQYADTESHWASKEITLAKALGITLDSYSFKPNNFITREDFVAFISRAFNITPSYAQSNFTDIDNSKYKAYITALNELGIINGYTDGTFRPNSFITRAELVTILSRLINFDVITAEDSKSFYDVPDNFWGKEAIDKVSGIGLVNGVSKFSFAPHKNTTRAEAVVIIIRMLKLDPKIDLVITEYLK